MKDAAFCFTCIIALRRKHAIFKQGWEGVYLGRISDMDEKLHKSGEDFRKIIALMPAARLPNADVLGEILKKILPQKKRTIRRK